MRAETASGGRARRRTSVWHRLAAVVLVPTLGLLALGFDAAHERWEVARHAEEVQEVVRDANAVLRLKLLLTSETFSTGGVATAERFGVEPEVMTGLIGFNPEERVAADRLEVDTVAALGAHLPIVSQVHGELVEVREQLDGGSLELAELLTRYSRLHEDLTLAADAALLEAVDAGRDVARSARLRRATTILRASVEAATAVGVTLDALAQLLTPAAPVNAQHALVQLRMGVALDETSAGTMDRETTGAIRAQWQAAHYGESTKILQEAARRFATMAPSEVPGMDFGQMIVLFAEGIDSLDDHDAVAESASVATTEAAVDLRDLAVGDLRTAVVVMVLAVLASLVVTILISRSIGRPMRALAVKAGKVTEGDLSVDGFAGSGPHELVAVGATLDELTDNLRVVESQLGALAAGNLADPVLDVPVPGRLGTLLHASVGRLSRSIGERQILGRKLEHDATHDALTGLANRGSFVDALRLALVEPDGLVAVIKLDLDGFKAVNEAHGHDAGDRVLRVVAERLETDLGNDALAARLGGDEFGVVVRGPAAVAADDLARRLIQHVGTPVSVGAVVTQVRASAGVAIAGPTTDVESLVRQAGMAARAAKAAGGGIARFDAAMLAEIERRADVERRLRHAMNAGELLLHFQPVVDADLRVTGAEALVRWAEPDGRLVPPGEFIPVAESSDLIVELGRWVLHEACRVLAGWRDDPELADLQLSVNLSGRHVMSMTVVDDVRTALELFGIEPRRLGIEVTETVLLTDLNRITEHLGGLRALGVTIEVDDFGTGYTSLAHLRQLPVDVLKVDRSLVVAAASRAADARVLDLVVGAAHALQLQVVAEGVETAEQLAACRSAGCDRVQGFLIARPAARLDLEAVAQSAGVVAT